MREVDRVREGVEFLRGQGVEPPALAIVLGSGLKGFVRHVENARELSFGEVPHWPTPRVEGHGASLVIGTVAGRSVACATGRVHLYEGWSPAEVVRVVRTLRLLGAPRFLISNAAGGLHPDWKAGDLMVIRDHLNLTGSSPLLGPHEPELGPRFPDQTGAWSARLRTILHGVDGELHEGVYAGNLGPAYETPAEVAMLARMGADAVGMSTVHEAMALRAMGAELAGISLISNQAAGISPQPLSHGEVVEAGERAAERLERLLAGFCAALED